MKKTQMAMLGVALVAGLSSMALAQGGGGGGGGGGGRGGRGGGARVSYGPLMAGIALTAADSAKLKPIDSVYTATRTQVYRDNGVMQTGRGGGGGGGGGAPMAIPDSVKAKLQPAIQKWELDLRAALGAPDKQAAFDANQKTFDPFAPPGRRGGGGGR